MPITNNPIRREDVERLARYNSEVERGLVHTPAYKEWMIELQEQFNSMMKKKAKFLHK